MIKVRYRCGYDGASLEPGAVYDVFDVAEPFDKVVFFGIEDELGDRAYYPWSFFDVVEGRSEAEAFGVK